MSISNFEESTDVGQNGEVGVFRSRLIVAMRPDSGWDLSVDDRNGQLALVVEVKRKPNVSPAWAAKLK